MNEHSSETESPSRLDAIVADVHRLLRKHRLLEDVARRQQTPRSALLEEMQHRQNLVELHRRLRDLHPADVANLLESLPPEDRSVVWDQLTSRLGGHALVEVGAGVRRTLIEQTSRERLVAMLRELDADDLRYLSSSLPDAVVEEVSAMLDARDRTWVEQSRAYPESSVARLMTQDVLSVRDSDTTADAAGLIRRNGRLPAHTDRIFIVDSRNHLIGALPLDVLLIAPPDAPLTSVMDAGVRQFKPDDDAEEVATAFERYDMLSAPIVDDRGKLIGRVTAHAVMDFIRATSQDEALALAGLRQAEDLFAPVADSARNRWPWLAVNLVTAFIASRIIGAFESTIQQLVALAALMPIVASVGGNTGNQTVALVVRGLALDQITVRSWWYLLRKEVTVSLLNGAIWGTLIGLFATAVYHSIALGAVMSAAVLLNLLIAAIVAVFVPLALAQIGRDPAQGASVVLTFVTDGMGFFLFLLLAKMFLL